MLQKSKYLITFVLLLATWQIAAVGRPHITRGAELPPNDSLAPVQPQTIKRLDSLDQIADTTNRPRPLVAPVAIDTLKRDTTATDTTAVKPEKKSAFDDVVNYQAQDSLIFFGTNNATLFGQGKVTYQDIELDADFIRMNMDSSVVYASGVPDSTGKDVGRPIFKQGQESYESTRLRYNFVTQKGFINNVITQQGEGYVVGTQTKKMENDDMYMLDCRYTTCDHHDHPHFYLNLTKAKVRPGKNIVTGPAYLVLADVPLPIALPFGYFPFNKTYSSGIIMPTFGDELSRGFYLSNGGYYFALSDYADLALTGEIYTKGSWGLNAQSTYSKRYKFNGNFNIGYTVNITGDKGLPDYAKSKDFKVNWTHTKDIKANPNLDFSASVNLMTSSYDRNNLNSYFDPNSYTNSTKSSSVSLGYRFPNSPFSITTSMQVTQSTRDSTLAVTLPDLTLAMSRIYPFKRRNAVGKERFYEKISLGYTGLIRNSITAKENEFFEKNVFKDWRNGMQHSIPVSASFSLLKYINLTPSFNYTERWYSNKVNEAWDETNMEMLKDTTYGFYRVYNYNVSLSAQSKLYGFYKPLPIFGNKVEMIRHVFTPQVSVSGNPDFSNPRYGFWKSFDYVNAQGETVTRKYSPYSNGLFGTAPSTQSGNVSFSFANNVEMKVRSEKDTTGFKKISLVENLTAAMSYDWTRDSLNWSNLTVNARFKITKNYTLNLNTTWDTYMYGLNEAGNPVQINKLRILNGKGLGRLRQTSFNFDYTFNNDTFRKKDKKKKDDPNEEEQGTSMGDNPFDNQRNETAKRKESTPSGVDSDGYQTFSFPWRLSFNYSLGMGYGTFNKKRMEYDYKLTHNLSANGDITFAKGWRFNLNTSWDFEKNRIAYMNCGITRDLHCWGISANFIPIGPMKYYNVSISVNSSLLKDLKYEKRSNPRDAMEWY